MKQRFKYFFAILLGSLFICSLSYSDLKVHFIDVGDGDCILIQTPNGQNILVDSGNLSSGYIVKEYLESNNIAQLESVIITHMHPDHVGGLFNFLPQIQTRCVYYNGYQPQNNEFYFEFINLIKAINISLKTLHAKDRLSYGKVILFILAPFEPLTGNMNSDSIAIKIIFDEISILLMGDLNKQIEKRLIEEEYTLKSDVLKVGHHGANDASSEEFLDKAKPKYAVLSVGKNNRYGYPSQEVIERFKKKEIPLYRTDIDGTIVIQTDGKTISIKLGTGHFF